MTKPEAVSVCDISSLTRILRVELNNSEDNIPSYLKTIKGWFVWKTNTINSDTGKFNKIPIYPRLCRQRYGVQGSEEDLNNLGTWDDARLAT